MLTAGIQPLCCVEKIQCILPKVTPHRLNQLSWLEAIVWSNYISVVNHFKSTTLFCYSFPSSLWNFSPTWRQTNNRENKRLHIQNRICWLIKIHRVHTIHKLYRQIPKLSDVLSGGQTPIAKLKN